MSLSPTFLNELRSRVTLSGVIGRTTRITKAGREFKACCPFHAEKTPSFTINDEKGFYHCFGCGAHGDVIRWMTDQRGLSFMDAVKELASEAGMEVPAPDPRAAQAAQQRDSLHDVMKAAQDWFASNLAGPEGTPARAYLAKRGFDARTIARFGFGYAPDGRQALKTALSRFPEAMLVEAGLLIAVDDDAGKPREPYDRFRGRLMLPIEDSRGRVIAFGGRILDDAKKDAPKYLNSPDTPLFDKGRTLYNLHRAGPASRQSGRLIVVEGYMDVIALAAAGIENVVAPLGTALTERQIEMAWRLVETPILCFDGDNAGQRAAMRAVSRALPMLKPAHSLRIVTLPVGMDPDDIVRRDGTPAMERLLAEARPLVDLLWSHERDAAPLDTPEDKAGLKARLMAHVDLIGDADIKALYRRELLARFSAFAFPVREFRPREATVKGARTLRKFDGLSHSAPSHDSAARLRRATGGGGRDALASAIIAGFVNWPAAIGRNADYLARAARLDSRFEVLLDALDAGEPLETARLQTILQSRNVALPAPDRSERLGYPFVKSGAEPSLAVAALEAALVKLVDEPAIDEAIRDATVRFDMDEQERLRRRKTEIGERLRKLVERPDRQTAE